MNTHIIFLGTSHFRCNSSKEVTSLIEKVNPDGIVLELDPERVIRLTKQYAGFDEDGNSRVDQFSDEDLLYGADFIAAVNAAQKLNIPLFLGDESVQDTKSRLIQQFLNWEAYSPVPLLKSFLLSMNGDNDMRRVRMDILQSFASDPQKLTPIAVSSSPPFLLASALAFFDNGAMAYDGSSALSSIFISLFAVSFLFNTVIAERDEILAANTMQASNVLRSLKDNVSIRKRWSFPVKKKKNEGERYGSLNNTKSIPLFTLKTSLVKDAIRNLNLFEPRWLNMIDEVTHDKSSLNEQVFGCVRCTNKFYSAVSVNGEEGRYADIIFDKVGTIGKIKQLKEGQRPSGDRKVNVSIQGGDSFMVDESNLSMSSDGYMVASTVKLIDESNKNLIPPSKEESKESVRLVVVVGLLHGNGIVDLLSKIK